MSIFVECSEGVLSAAIAERCQAIVQQENHTGFSAKGLSAAVKEKYPYGHVLHQKPSSRPLGSTLVCRPPEGVTGPAVVNFIAQRNPGPAVERVADSAEERESWFLECLEKLKKEGFESVAFPEKIGCGLAGGNWQSYSALIEEWAKEMKIRVCIVRMSKKPGYQSESLLELSKLEKMKNDLEPLSEGPSATVDMGALEPLAEPRVSRVTVDKKILDEILEDLDGVATEGKVPRRSQEEYRRLLGETTAAVVTHSKSVTFRVPKRQRESEGEECA